jgi:hypothetical protein
MPEREEQDQTLPLRFSLQRTARPYNRVMPTTGCGTQTEVAVHEKTEMIKSFADTPTDQWIASLLTC